MSGHMDLEAEASGEDNEEDEEEALADDAVDESGNLEGLIADDDGAENDHQADASSSSSDLDEDLNEEDLAVLEEAGLDPNQVSKKRRTAGGLEAALETAARGSAGKRPRSPDRARDPDGKDDASWDLSGDEGVEEFVVEDDGGLAKRRRKEEADELNITEDQLKDIIDIFGDTSVLRAIDQVEELPVVSIVPEISVAAGPLQDIEVEAKEAIAERAALRNEAQKKADQFAEEFALDPDLQETLYAMVHDFELEALDLPERWVQKYHAYPELLNSRGVRHFTDDEHDCEARWIYCQAMDKPGYERQSTLATIRKILKLMHIKMLEPAHIIREYAWQFVQVLRFDEIHIISDLDLRWQSIWLMYERVSKWVLRVGEARVPEHVRNQSCSRIFDTSNAELLAKDAFAWLACRYPDAAPPGLLSFEPSGASATRDAQLITQIQRSNFYAQLNNPTEEDWELFGITPDQLGQNIASGSLEFKSVDGDVGPSPSTLCSSAINDDFQTKEAVEDAIIVCLARMIATDPRVRDFVRQQFMKMCAVSTFVTAAGRASALEAAQLFEDSYAAFHLVNRPIERFTEADASGDLKPKMLFLECLDLQRKGFVELEWSLTRHIEGETSFSYVLVLPGRDAEQVGRDKQKLIEFEEYVTKSRIGKDEDASTWAWCDSMRQRLLRVARAHQAVIRRLASDTPKDKAKAMFVASSIQFRGVDLNNYMTHDPIFQRLQQLYCSLEAFGGNEVYVIPNAWNSLRSKVLRRVLVEELYPLFWQEAQAKLTQDAEREVVKLVCNELTKMIDVQPYCLTQDKIKEMKEDYKAKVVAEEGAGVSADIEDIPEWKEAARMRSKGLFPVLVITPSGEKKASSAIALVNPYGDPVELRVFFSNFYAKESVREMAVKKGSADDLKRQKRLEHRATFKKMLLLNQPGVVLIIAADSAIKEIKDGIIALFEEPDVKDEMVMLPVVLVADPAVPRAVAYHERIKEEGAYRDCITPSHRVALSAARFLQDPLAEVCQLWHEKPEENGLLKIPFHRLQHMVPQSRMSRAMVAPIMDAVGKVGLHVNRIRRSVHLLAPAMFAPGLGPRKARLLRRCIMGDQVSSREALASQITSYLRCDASVKRDPFKSIVVQNLMPFIKICPDERDDERDLWPRIVGLDLLRLGPPYWPWVLSLCRATLDKLSIAADKGADVVKMCIDLHRSQAQDMNKVLNEADLENWADAAGAPEEDGGVLDMLLDCLVSEITNPFRDLRQAFQELTDQKLFELTYEISSTNMKEGRLVNVTVKADKEFPMDPDKRKRPEVSCEVLPFNLMGFFRKQEKDAEGGLMRTLPGCDREFIRDDAVVARVQRVITSGNKPQLALSVDMDVEIWASKFPVREDEDVAYFVPLKSEDWTVTTLGLVDASKDVELAKKQDWINRPRNVRHSNWNSCDLNQAVRIMATCPLNFVLFRPSKHHDCIVAMLKVCDTEGDHAVPPDKCFRSFNVFERGPKEVRGFEMSKTLEVDGINYNDLDEVIARHFDPISDHLRRLQEHPRFGLQNGLMQSKTEVSDGLKMFSNNSKGILLYAMVMHPVLAGHGMLLWTMGGHRVKEDLIEVSPRGYALWGQNFVSLKEMLHWFKVVGFKNVRVYRKEYEEAWLARCKEAKDKRGVNVRGVEQEELPSLNAPVSLTPSTHPPDLSSAAAALYSGGCANPQTPSGLMTPMGTPMSPGHGGVTPMPPLPVPANRSAVPMTPLPIVANRGAGATPVPITPVAAFAARSNTQAIAYAPITPAPPGFGPLGSSAAPSTPLAASTRSGAASSTAPSTPPGAFYGLNAAPMTPLEAYQRSGSGGVPSTPTPATGVVGAFKCQPIGGVAPSTPNAVFEQGAPTTGEGGAPITPTPATGHLGTAPITPVDGAQINLGAAPKTPIMANIAVPSTPLGANARGGVRPAPTTPHAVFEQGAPTTGASGMMAKAEGGE